MNWTCITQGHQWSCQMSRSCRGDHYCVECGKRGPAKPKRPNHLMLLWALFLRRIHGGRLWVKGADGQWHDADTWEVRQN